VAHLWVEDGDNGWCVAPLKSDRYALTADEDRPLRPSDSAGGRRSAVIFKYWDTVRGCPRWAFLAGARATVSVNGSRVIMSSGLRVLQDMDELRVGELEGSSSTRGGSGHARRFYFSTERVPEVVPFPGGPHRIVCPRCKQEIREKQPAVQCPGDGCGRWYHQGGEYLCWTYAETCSYCPQRTDLAATYTRTPEDL
jgi:hypothetical protein